MAAPPLAETFADAKAHVQNLVAATAGNLWDGLASHDRADIPVFFGKLLPVLEAGERQVISLTEAYLTQELGRRPQGVDPDRVIAGLRGGVDPTDVYRRPFVQLWWLLRRGRRWEQASHSARARLEAVVKTDMALAMTHTFREVGLADPHVFAWKRVTRGTCNLCQDVKGDLNGAAVLQPIHVGCECVSSPVTRPTRTRQGPHQVSTVREHGELGPVLVDQSESFAGPGGPTGEIFRVQSPAGEWRTLTPGERVRFPQTGWTGTVERVKVNPPGTSKGTAMVRVRWDQSGASGRVTGPNIGELEVLDKEAMAGGEADISEVGPVQVFKSTSYQTVKDVLEREYGANIRDELDSWGYWSREQRERIVRLLDDLKKQGKLPGNLARDARRIGRATRGEKYVPKAKRAAQAAKAEERKPTARGTFETPAKGKVFRTKDCIRMGRGKLSPSQRTAYDRGVADIDAVHRYPPEFKDHTVYMKNASAGNVPGGRTAAGSYNSGFEEVKLGRSSALDGPSFQASVVTHELGHWFDDIFGRVITAEEYRAYPYYFASERGQTELLEVLRAIDATGMRERVLQNTGGDYQEYLLRPREQFARAYAQYIAVRSGDLGIKLTLEGQYRQWTGPEFVRIANAFDEFFRSQGLLVRPEGVAP